MRVAKRLMTHPPPSHEKGKDRNLFQKISIFTRAGHLHGGRRPALHRHPPFVCRVADDLG